MSGNEPAPVDPGPIMRLSTAYWDSRCFLTAHALGVFETLAEGPLTAEAVARERGLDARATRLLLKACVGLGLLEEDERGFRDAPSTRAFLVPGSPTNLGNAISYANDMWDAWSALAESVRSGRPALATESYTGGDPERTRHFVRGMHDRAMGIGSLLAALVDLGGRKRLLDVGGGPGTFSALFARAHPELRATVLDLPEVVALAREILAETGAGDRVDTLPGDYKRTPFPKGVDVVLISGVFHRETEATCRDLITRAADALAPDGLLVVSDVFADAGGATPAFASLFGLNMMLSAPDGGMHADAEVAGWMRAAGFGSVETRPFPPPMPHRIVTGTRLT